MAAKGCTEFGRSAANRTILALTSLVAMLHAAGAFASPKWEPITVNLITAPNPFLRDGTVEFPNASAIHVTFRARTDELPPTPAPLAQYPTHLRAAQQGDAQAAGIVGRLLTYCARVRGIAFSTPNTETRKSIPLSKNPDARSLEVREFCAQRTVQEIASGVTWLETAVAAGDVAAAKQLPWLYLHNSSEHVQAWQKLWQLGSIDALRRLAEMHGWRSVHYGSDSPDRIMALASYLLYAKLTQAAYREDQSISAFIDFLARDAERRLAKESPHVRNEAIAFAHKSLSENTRCCFLR